VSLKVATRIRLGFGALLGVLAVLAVIGALVGRDILLVDDALDRIARVKEPVGAAAHAMEMKVLGSGMAVLKYVESGDLRYRRRVDRDRADLDRLERQYDRLARTPRERELGRRLAELAEQYRAVGDALMTKGDARRHALALLGESSSRRDQIVTAALLGDGSDGGGEPPLVRSGLAQLREDLAEMALSEASFASTRDPAYRAMTEKTEGLTRRVFQLTVGLQEDVQRFVLLCDQLDALLDDEVQAVTPGDLEAAKEAAQRRARTIGWALVTLVTAGIAVGLTTATGVSRAIAGPVRRLVTGTQRFGSGDLDHRIELPRSSEFGGLGDAPNQMAAERRATEEAIRQSEERFFQGLIEHASDTVLILDADGLVRYASPAARPLFGQPLSELLGRPVLALVTPADAPALRAALAAVPGRELERFGPIRLARADGDEVVAYGVVARTPGGTRHEGIVVTLHDATQQVVAARALRASEERYRTLVESTSDLVLSVTAGGDYLFVNAAWTKALGYTLADLRGVKAWKAVHPDSAAHCKQMMWLAAAQGQARFEVAAVAKDGRVIPLEGNVVAQSEAGRVVAFHGFFRDVSERKTAEAAAARLRAELEAAAQDWQRTFDVMRAGIVVCDAEGRVTRANRVILEQAGRRLEDVRRQPLASLGPGEPWQSAGELVDEVRQTRSGASRHVRTQAPARHWDVAVTLSPGAGEREDRLILVTRDITQLTELQEAARRAETMAVLGALVGGVAHEVRNPLFGITATLDALEAEAGKGPHEEHLHVMRGEVERLNHLMRELLEYGKPFSTTRTPGSVDEVIRESVRACAPLAERSGVTIALDVPPDLPPALLDRSRLRQVFQNALENAIQHSPPGETVRVSAAAWTAGDPPGVECTVADVGPGFSKEDLVHVFQPFFTRRAGGTGLGLAIAHRIVDEHQGSIAVRNGAGAGAVVVVRLPGTSERAPGSPGGGR
jgi:PAS domain S-box-containing protein